MALKWIEGFDYINTAGLSVGMYEDVGDTARVTVTSTAVRYGTQGLRVQATSGGASGNGWIRKIIGGTEDVVIQGFAFFPVSNSSGDVQLCGFYESTTLHVDLRMTTGTASYDLKVTRNGTQLGTNAVAALTDNTWHYIEMKVLIHDTTGTVDVWVNGVSVISLTGQDTRNAGTGFCDRALLGNATGNNSNHDMYFDDWYVLDDTGSLNNARLGDSRVAALYPTAEAGTIDWTPSTGTDNSALVDEPNAPNGDTDYNSSATAGNIDLFTLADLPTSAGTVAGIKEIAYYRKDDAGARTLRHVIRTSATNYEGSDISVADTYNYTGTIRETNPNTSAAWTEAAINGLEAGYKLEA